MAPFRSSRGAVLAVGLSVVLSGCSTGWMMDQRFRPLSDRTLDGHPVVRVAVRGGGVCPLRYPRVVGDSLVGTSTVTDARVAVATADVVRIAVRDGDGAREIHQGPAYEAPPRSALATVAGVGTLVGLMVAYALLFPEEYEGPE